MKRLADSTFRLLRTLRRPAKGANLALLKARGETVRSLTIRDATSADIPALAQLHVATWNATYGVRAGGPTHALREQQWREVFQKADGSWFCFVVERANGELIGFAKGQRYAHSDLPDFAGELSKIYLLEEYQRVGLGRRLVGHVSRRFLDQGIGTMVLFGDPRNPSCACWEALGGERLYSPRGDFDGGYGWRNLHVLASICPAD